MPGQGWKGGFRGKGRGESGGRGRGEFRLTSARETILNILSKESKHLAADEIFTLARNISPGIGLATIYRTLDVLSNMGIIKKLDFGTGMSKYEIVQEKAEGYRHYIVCESCGKVVDNNCFEKKEIESFESFAKKMQEEYGFKIDLNRIQFYGLCKRCV